MAYLINDRRGVCHPPELQYDNILNQTAVVSKQFYDVYPTNSYSLDQDAPIEFTISGKNSTDFIDLHNSTLYVKFNCKKNTNQNIELTDCIGVNNAPFHGLWKSVDVAFNGQNVVTNEDCYAYKSFLKIVQTLPAASTYEHQPLYNREMTSLESGLSNDTKVHTTDTGCDQLVNRITLASTGKSIELESTLREDVFDIQKFIPNGVDVRIKLTRNPIGFILKNSELTENTPTNLTVNIEAIKLRICKVKLEPSYFTFFNEQLLREPILIRYDKTEIHRFYVDKDSSQMILNNVFTQKNPSRLLVTFIDQGVAEGSGTDYVFKFPHNGLTSIALYVNGVPRPGQPIEPDYTTGSYTQAFNSFCSDSSGRDLQLTKTDFMNCYAIYAFDIAKEVEGCNGLVRSDTIRIEAKFTGGRTKSLTCMILAYFPSVLAIDSNREISFY